MFFQFPNFDNNEYIEKYNNLVCKIKKNEKYNIMLKESQLKRDDKDPMSWTGKMITIHHIIPKKINPHIQKDKRNLLYVNFEDHCMLHYYLWKANPEYGPHLWFICVAGRKMKIWDLPGGEEDYDQLKKDVSYYNNLKRKLKNKKE